MARLVQFARQTKLDASPSDHRPDLTDSLPDHRHHVRLRLCASRATESPVARGAAVRHQSRRQPDLHSDSVWDAESAISVGGHFDRAGNNRLDDRRHLAALSLGGIGPGSILGLGFDCDGTATVDHGHELGEVNLPTQGSENSRLSS